MITSALVSELRREYADRPKSVSVSRESNGSVGLFNTGKFPIIENSYSVYVDSVLKTQTTDFSIDLDNGDVEFVNVPQSGLEVRADFQTAEWRDKNWVEAINQGIDSLNAKGFFQQVVRQKNVVGISAGLSESPGPSGAISVYELLVSDNNTSAGNFSKPRFPWQYEQGANKILFDGKPYSNAQTSVSYLRNMRTYSATSATLDVLDDWKELIKKKAGALYFRALAAKIAKQGNATVDEGHFSFTNLRTMANDLDAEFEKLALRKKPTRPAVDINFA